MTGGQRRRRGAGGEGVGPPPRVGRTGPSPARSPAAGRLRALTAAALLAAVPALAGPRALHAQSPASAPSGPTGASSILSADLRQHVGALAHDSLRGRDTPSPGLERAAAYVEARFRAYGLKPGLGDGYQQRYPVTVVEPGDPGSQRLVLTGPGRRSELRVGEDFVPLPTADSVTAAGPLGARASDAGAAPDGRVLATVARPDDLRRVLSEVRSELSRGPVAAALVMLDAPRRYFDRVAGYFGSRRISLGTPEALRKPVVLVSPDALPDRLRDPLLDGRGPPGGWSAELRTTASVRGEEAMNTIGWIEGSDPDLRDEYVVFTAHLDHLGVGRPVDGDSIYNGADDDASGTAAVLELAQAFASRPDRPRRSLVFMTFSGEEKGLLGSRWYAEHPVFPLERTAAGLNMDMIGRNWADTVVAIGQAHSSLGATVQRAARRHPELGLTVVEDRWPERNFFSRSDHYNLARHGVPILFFFSGLHADYHGPDDEAAKIKYDKTARIVRLIYHTGRAVADADRRPRWDEEAYREVVEGSDGGL